MNCGGIRGKLSQLVALVVETDPDAVLLQEASGLEQEGDLGPLGLRAFYGAPRRGGESLCWFTTACSPKDTGQRS